jgi:glycosyltransferase involved in cell wall biosynthesis
MAERPPLVSICIPLYNAAAFIGATIESVLRQTYSNLELIVVDDLSNDGSWEIVLGYRDQRIRLVRNPERLGAEGNWNKAISEARGEFVKLLCHDDLLAATCVERQVSVLLAQGNHLVSLVSCARGIVDSDGRLTMRRRWFRKDTLLKGRQAIRTTMRSGTNLIGEPTATLFRAADARRLGGFDGRHAYVIDLDYWVRLLAEGDFYYIAESLCSFRISRQSWSWRLGRRQSHQFVHLIKQVWIQGRYGVTGLDLCCGVVLCWIKGLARRCWFSFRA